METVSLILNLEITTKMAEAKVMERIEEANSDEEKALIVQSTEKFVVDAANMVTKDDSELNEEEVELKKEFIQDLIENHYEFFEVEDPFSKGTTIEDVLARNSQDSE